MTLAQLTFAGTLLVLSTALTPVLYPGVRKRASSRRNTLLASWMASALLSVFVAWIAAALVNAAS